MKYVCVSDREKTPGVRIYGVLDEERRVVRTLKNTPFAVDDANVYKYDELLLDEVEILAPIIPSKIVAVGKNYHAHAMEMNEGEPEEPLLFLKPNTCITRHMGDVVYPSISHRLDYEGELGVVIGKTCRYATEEDAYSYVFGYTCLNDITARDIQKGDPQWTRGKSFDTFCPIGPWIVSDIKDPQNLHITTRLNGKTVQDSNTSCMTHSIPKLIAYISRCMTLLPGDIIATGTPEGIGSMQVGDTVEVELEQIGILSNRIVEEKIK